MKLPCPIVLPRCCLVLLAASFLMLCPDARAQTAPTLSIQNLGPVARLTVSGARGSFCQVQYATNLPSTSWFPLTNLTFYSNTAIAVESLLPSSAARFYRTLTSVATNLAWIPSGTFVMGSPTNESARGPNSETQHTVTLSKGLYMGRWLVTQSSYRTLMNTNPSYFNTNHGYSLDLTRPVEQVSWADVTNYCGRFTLQEQTAGRIPTNFVYRLPTEAEWEYACRAGTTAPFYYGNSLSNNMANFDGEYEYVGGIGTVLNPAGVFLNRTTSVGSYTPNAWGLYDMAGNSWEWCQDWYATFSTGAQTDPQGPFSGSERVFRGGTFNAIGALCRSANRNKTNPNSGANTIGFRYVLALAP